MGDNCGPRRISDNSFVIPRSESKSMAGQKRGSVEVGERSELGHKRVKIRDLETVFCSKGIDAHYPKSWKNNQDMSQVTKETVTMISDASQSGKMRKDASHVVVGPALIELDLNAKVDIASNLASDNTVACVEDTNNLASYSEGNIEKSRGFGLDLNAEEVSSSINHDPFYPRKFCEQLKLRDASECGSTCGPLEEKDAMKVWKEMKQNGFMSNSHGGVPIPKPRGRKSKADGLKKKMEIARREQVDRFAKIAAPSGLLNGLNPGIINHVRNSKQVHSIIEALVRSERRESRHAETKHEEIEMKNERIESSDMKVQENLNRSGLNRYNLCHEDGLLNTLSRSRQTSNCPMSSGHIDRENDSSMVEKRVLDKTNLLFYSNLQNEENILALKLSSSATMASENMSSLSNEESANITSVSSLSVKAANVASQWLELLHLDIKGRLAALQRSKKRVRAVIQTELPFLMCREFSYNLVNNPYVNKVSATGSSGNATADVHKARWSALFNQMEKALSEEEKQLETWLNQVEEMQLHCDRGLFQCTGAPGMQQLGTSENDCRLEKKVNESERDLAVRAAAAAFYSTCNFLQTMENLPCF